MYSTCLFCHGALGANEVIERFAVGRRLAFDPAKGRLWVICQKCQRWNLTPLEERWEAIEDCERRFRAIRNRVSTGEIALGRLPEGLALVRIGAPLRPEMAAWRYGSQLVQRWRRRVAAGIVGVPLSIGAGVLVAQFRIATGTMPTSLMPSLSPLAILGVLGSQATLIQTLRFAFAEDPLRVWRAARPPRARLDEFGAPGTHRLQPSLVRLMRDPAPDSPWFLRVGCWIRDADGKRKLSKVDVTGQAALALTTQVLTHHSHAGGRRRLVDRAISRLESAGSPDALYQKFAKPMGRYAPPRPLVAFARDERLALEMAANDETERRAMEGELRALEAQWRSAEEIAAVADNMFLPTAVTDFLGRNRRAPGAPQPAPSHLVDPTDRSG